MNIFMRRAFTVCIVAAVSACGGGGTGNTTGPNSGGSNQAGYSNGTDGTPPPMSSTLQLRLSPDLPDNVNASSVTDIIVLAVEPNGTSRDVTASAQVTSNG